MIHTEDYNRVKKYNSLNSEYKYRFQNYAMSNNFPIINEDALQFLIWFSKMTNPKSILELGTGFGFMAYHLLKSNPESTLTGIDYTADNYDVFKSLKPEADIQKRYRFIEANVMYWISSHQEKYDWIIIDCDKKYYPLLIEPCLDKLKIGGLLIADNVLWKGMVADAEKKNKVEPIIKFNSLIADDKRLESVIVPIGDGVSLSRKIR